MQRTTEDADGDAVLVRRAQAGDRLAFDRLVERHFAAVHAVARARLREREAAEDLAQEVFLRAYLRLDALRDPACVAAWLGQMTRHLATDWIRREATRSALLPKVSLEDVAMESPDAANSSAFGGAPAPDPREAAAQREEHCLLDDALARLPVEQRELLLLHYAEERSTREIAAVLGIHWTTVGRQLKQAVAALQRKLVGASREAPPALPELRSRAAVAARTLLVVSAVAGLTGSARAELEEQAGGGLASAALPGEAGAGLKLWLGTRAIQAWLVGGLGVLAVALLVALEPWSVPRPGALASHGKISSHRLLKGVALHLFLRFDEAAHVELDNSDGGVNAFTMTARSVPALDLDVEYADGTAASTQMPQPTPDHFLYPNKVVILYFDPVRHPRIRDPGFMASLFMHPREEGIDVIVETGHDERFGAELRALNAARERGEITHRAMLEGALDAALRLDFLPSDPAHREHALRQLRAEIEQL